MSQRQPTLDQLYKDYNMARNHESTIFDMMCKELERLQKENIELRAKASEVKPTKKPKGK